MSDGREYPCAPGASHRDTETRRSHSDEPVGVIRTVGYPMIATTARSLSHNPVRLSVLLLPVMRLVFKTTDGVVEPGSTRADGSDVSVASTHRFRDRRNRWERRWVEGFGRGRLLCRRVSFGSFSRHLM